MRQQRRRGLAALVLLLVAADWLSKLWVLNRVALGDTLAVVEGWFYLAHRQNTGVAFGLLGNLPASWLPIALSAVGVVVAAALLRLLHGTSDHLARLAIAVMVAGAIGNLGDRVVNGSVTDFLLLAAFPYVFNLADAAITSGAVLFGIRMLLFPGSTVSSTSSTA